MKGRILILVALVGALGLGLFLWNGAIGQEWRLKRAAYQIILDSCGTVDVCHLSVDKHFDDCYREDPARLRNCINAKADQPVFRQGLSPQ